VSAGLKAVFLAERRMLLRLLTARLRDAEAAEDVLQDIWLKLESAGSGPVADPAAYLYRMANNLAFDRRRSEVRRQSREGAWLELRGDEEAGVAQDRALLAREQLFAMQQAIAALPERTAAIFRRYRFDEVPRKDIAIEYGISVSAVEKHLQRAYRIIVDARAQWGVDSQCG
jgi:RNA polymerase sigma factor (sigma-70 family)